MQWHNRCFMHSHLILIAIILLLALPAIAADPSSADAGTPGSPAAAASAPSAYDPFGYTEDQFSSWGLIDAAYPYQGRHGCYPMGNGICFAHLGVAEDFNTLRGIIGPGYQTNTPGGETEWWAEGEYPDIKFELRDGTGQALAWTSQSIQVLRGAAIVRTKLSGPRGSLWCLSYANPDYPAIERHFEFEPADGKLDRSLRLYVNPAGGAWDEQGGLSAPAGKRISLWMYEEHEDEADENQPGQAWSPGTSDPRSGATRWSMALSFAHEGELPDLSFVGDPNRGRMLVKQHWDKWSAGSRSFDTGNLKLDDLMLQVPVIIETQRDSASGGVAPMVSYHGYWVRDTTGPLLCYMENGRFEEVRRMLTYHRKASWKLGACRMSVPLDVDVGEVEEPVGLVGVGLVLTLPVGAGQSPRPAVHGEEGADTTAPLQEKKAGQDPPLQTWDTVAVEPAEVPSLIVLQHYWYWKARREAGLPDDGFIAEAWPYLRRNLFGMAYDPSYGVKFHGDETYAHGALYSTFDNDTTEDGAPPGSGKPLGYPNGYIPTDFFNRDNTMLHREAAKALAEMAGELGQSDDAAQATALQRQFDVILENFEKPAISDVTHQPWPGFFSNINLGHYVLDLDGSQSDHYLDWLINIDYQYDDGTGTTPWSQYITGHTPAGWLAAFGREGVGMYGDRAFPELMELAWPDAGWCEVYGVPQVKAVPDPLAPAGSERERLEQLWETRALEKKEEGTQGEYRLPELEGSMSWSNEVWKSYVYSRHGDPENRPFGLFTRWVPDRKPVNIYGRINRIRPWESGINYAVLCRHLDHRPPFNQHEHVHFEAGVSSTTAVGRNTELLVLTRDNHYKDVIASDYRLGLIDAENTDAWDIGLPMKVDDLRRALIGPFYWFNGSGYIEIPDKACVPYLYLDRDVKLSDRRTFKTAAFWESAEMLQLMADYKAAGGIVLEESDLRPAWELQTNFRPNPENSFGPDAPFRPGLSLRVDGPPGRYQCQIDFASDYNTIQQMLAFARLLPQAARLETEILTEPGKDAFIELDRYDWESLMLAPGKVSISFLPGEASKGDAPAVSHVHSIPAQEPIDGYLSFLDYSMIPPEVPQARQTTPVIDGILTPHGGGMQGEWPIYPSLGLLPSGGNLISGRFDPGGDAGLSLNFAFDQRDFYISGTVLDDQIVPGGLWQGERINFVFDARNDSTKLAYSEGSVDKDKWQADDFWIALAPFCTDKGSAAQPLVQRIGGSASRDSDGWSETRKGFYGEVPGARCVVKTHADGRGYDFELALPLDSLPFLQATPGRFCGFGVFITDVDAPDNNGEAQPSQSSAELMWLTDWRAPQGGISWNFWDCGLLYFGL